MNQSFSSNAAYRRYLVSHADSIIQDNQLNSSTNCSNIDNYPVNHIISNIDNNNNYFETGKRSDFKNKIKYLQRKFIEASSCSPCIEMDY